MEPVEGLVYTITEEDRQNYKRLDQWLVAKTQGLSRTTLKSLFLAEDINLHEDSPYQGKLELKKLPPIGTQIEVHIPAPVDYHVLPEPIPLEILFEDEHLVIIVKPAGMVTHPAPGHYQGTLVNAILHHCPDLSGVGNTKRPGIVHRLDKGTSGVMVVAKTHQCHEKCVELFSTHNLTRRYEALCLGSPRLMKGTLESTIGRHPQNRKKMAANVRGKKAITHYKVLERFDHFTHFELTLETGRTHQIRVHLTQLLQCPILMDDVYGEPRRHLKPMADSIRHILQEYPYPLLHAKQLSFEHPVTKELLDFHSPAPQIFQQTLEGLQEFHEISSTR